MCSVSLKQITKNACPSLGTLPPTKLTIRLNGVLKQMTVEHVHIAAMLCSSTPWQIFL